MSVGRVLLDTAVFVYAVGGDHPYREPCRQLLTALAAEEFGGEASVLVVEETLQQRARRTGDGDSAVRVAQQITALCPLHALTGAELALGLDLIAGSRRLNARDVLHAATALTQGIDRIVSPDRAFDDVDSLERLDPRDAAAEL